MDIPALPPRPDPRTGLPRPPHGPLEAGWTPGDPDQNIRSIPEPPPGQGSVLEHYRPSARRAMIAAGIGSISMFLFASLLLHGFGWVTESRLWAAWLIIVGIFPLVYSAIRSDRITAGADWLQEGKRWVQTYELSEVTLKPSGGNLMLQLGDRFGRKVRIRWDRIQDNRALWDLVYNGILHSVCLEHAETDAGARRHLNLPGNP